MEPSAAADSLRSADERPISFIPSLRPSSAAAQPAAASQADWPRGTVTFLFTDIVDSTQLWEQHPQVMPQVLVRHDALVRAAIAAQGGVVFKTLGDAVCAAFARAPDALAAARVAQHTLQAEDWTALGLPPEGPLQVRMALHTGAADARNSDYIGPPLNRVARILALGHGGQILLSHATRELEVLRLVAAGQSNQAIAQTLIIAESTVKMHLKNVYGKLDAHSRTQAIACARQLGLL
jgi:class 3 adenylate cyclase